MTLADIAVWTENWLEQTGQQPTPHPHPTSNGSGTPDAWEEFQVG